MRRPFALLLFLTVVPPVSAETFAVLPFFNLTKNSSLDWIGESIAESVRDALLSHGVLALERSDRQEVYRRLSIRPYAQLTQASVIKLGETLDATHVIYGRYELSEKRALRITARILDLSHMRQGPEFGEVGTLDDLAALQSHLAWQTLQFVAPGSAPAEAEFRKARPPVRIDAMEHYVRGLLATTPDQKHRLFALAARLDQGFSHPAFELGKLAWEKDDFRSAIQWFQKVKPVDAHRREATFLLGLSKFYTGDYAGAEAAFATVAREVPLNEVLNNLGAAQSRRDSPDALANFLKALEGDAGDPDYHFNLGYAMWKQGKYEAAADSFRAVLDRDPEDSEAIAMLGKSLKKSPYQRAGEPLERVKETYKESVYLQLKQALEPRPAGAQ